MASPESMKKEELVDKVRTLTQELKRLLNENEELKAIAENSTQSKESLNFDSLGVVLKMNDFKNFDVILLKYDSKAEQGILEEKVNYPTRHQAEFKAKEFFHTKVLKGGL
jgi:hypothetical protein